MCSCPVADARAAACLRASRLSSHSLLLMNKFAHNDWCSRRYGTPGHNNVMCFGIRLDLEITSQLYRRRTDWTGQMALNSPNRRATCRRNVRSHSGTLRAGCVCDHATADMTKCGQRNHNAHLSDFRPTMCRARLSELQCEMFSHRAVRLYVSIAQLLPLRHAILCVKAARICDLCCSDYLHSGQQV